MIRVAFSGAAWMRGAMIRVGLSGAAWMRETMIRVGLSAEEWTRARAMIRVGCSVAARISARSRIRVVCSVVARTAERKNAVRSRATSHAWRLAAISRVVGGSDLACWCGSARARVLRIFAKRPRSFRRRTLRSAREHGVRILGRELTVEPPKEPFLAAPRGGQGLEPAEFR
jgi:hypothetical protein